MPFQKGNKLGGRPRRPELETLRTALERFKKENKIDFIQLAVNKAGTDTGLMIAILKKILPDLSEDFLKENPDNVSKRRESVKDFLREVFASKQNGNNV